MEKQTQMDLELKELNQFYGTEYYHKVGFFPVKATDGVEYIMENGYAWFITDTLAVIYYNEGLKLKGQEFLTIDLKLLPDNKGIVEITDGNNNILHKQEYKYTDAKREIRLFLTDGVLMLASEY